MNETRVLPVSLFVAVIVLTFFVFWPTDPQGNTDRLPELLNMQQTQFSDVADGEFVFATDWDGDGADELVVAGGNSLHILAWHPADHYLYVVQKVVAGEGKGPLAGLSFDWDGDGDQELIVAQSYGLVLIENRNGQIYVDSLVSWEIDQAWMAVSDADGDGVAELSIATVTGMIRKTTILSADMKPIYQLDDYAGPMAWSDLDQDGLSDLLLAQPDQKLALITRSHQDAEFELQRLESGYGQWSSLSTGDMDGDGDQDVLLASGGYSSSWQYFENRSDKARLRLKPVTLSSLSRVRYSTATEIIDINADGLADVLASQAPPRAVLVGCCEGKALIQLRANPQAQQSQGEFANAAAWSQPLRDALDMTTLDVNGDGLADIAAIGQDGIVRIAINPRDQNYLAVRLPQNASSLGARVQVMGTGGKSRMVEMQGYGDLVVGLGRHWKVDSLTVGWPDGAVTFVEQPHINQRLKVTR